MMGYMNGFYERDSSDRVLQDDFMAAFAPVNADTRVGNLAMNCARRVCVGYGKPSFKEAVGCIGKVLARLLADLTERSRYAVVYSHTRSADPTQADGSIDELGAKTSRPLWIPRFTCHTMSAP